MPAAAVMGDQPFPYEALAAGGTVELTDGVYALNPANVTPSYHVNIPAGATLKAADGARPVITLTDGYAPKIQIGAGATLEGVWIGGAKSPNGTNPGQYVHTASDAVIQHNTFFGYWECLASDFTRNHVYRNRFIHCGSGVYYHAIYYSGGIALLADEPIFEENLFIGGEGYGLHFWHDPLGGHAKGNFFGDVRYGAVIDGDSGRFERNIIWRSFGTPAFLSGTGANQTATRFLIGPSNGDVSSAVTDSVFMQGKTPVGTGAVQWTDDDLSSELSITSGEINAAIAGIKEAFTTSIADMRTKQASVEAHYATLQSLIDAWVVFP